jgi:fructose-bisphosphate aldolase class II
MNSDTIVRNALRIGAAVPAFNVPYLPMLQPVVQAVVDQNSFAFIEIARIEWVRGEAVGPAVVMNVFKSWQRPGFVRLHLDHIPVVDETQAEVDYVAIIAEGLRLGYHSVMVDASRLELEGNIAATRAVVEMAHAVGVPVEAELGAVLGHGDVKPPPYDELFAKGIGFTKVEEARRFVRETGCDWLSVAVGTIHGAFANLWKDEKKPQARLKLELVEELSLAAGIPLVLHGGSGVHRDDLLAGVKKGIGKINVATEIRQPYENALRSTGSLVAAQDAVYRKTCWLINEYYGWSGNHDQLVNEGEPL